VMVVAAFRDTVTVLSVAIGASFTAVTVMVTLANAGSLFPSFTFSDFAIRGVVRIRHMGRSLVRAWKHPLHPNRSRW